MDNENLSHRAAKNFKELLVWQKAHQLVLAIYKLSSEFPSHELYGLTSQLRRSAVSVPANIAEGFNRKGVTDKLKFFNYAMSSLEECKYHLVLATDLEYGNGEKLSGLTQEVSKLLVAYTKAIEKKN